MLKKTTRFYKMETEKLGLKKWKTRHRIRGIVRKNNAILTRTNGKQTNKISKKIWGFEK